MNNLGKYYIVNLFFVLLIQLCNGQNEYENGYNSPVNGNVNGSNNGNGNNNGNVNNNGNNNGYGSIVKTTRFGTINRTRNPQYTRTIPYTATTGYFTTTRSSFTTSIYENNSNEAINGADSSSKNSTLNHTYDNSTLEEIGIEKPINWTSGYGTHYGPFPSNPHFSEVGYQPNDVGVGCSDGRPGGDPQWNKILDQGLNPSPNIANHEKTIWPKAYTVAVSAAVWNKEDVCWKSIKIRNKKKPKFSIEAYIVDFCPIGHCLWKDKYLARNVDIYGEKAWVALGADINDSKLDIEIEWPEGVIPHDAISTSFTRISKTIMSIFTPFIITIFIF
ncbi:hypothetical protein BCR32DRAFT_203107 [Anaeromyces robustus]|jgi:hypothetical protein|uniref:RlpA-like protein double-psi beta-barrel domain-containing protein n=1 Tax=Anaeromyces robustus TaxID=1754192 RepID=A0A1Y1X9M4_9FUNG|nr:hypothetical protein BCR32DRAFT_203107 [Anaeromyces robustus]|eukprot:ORX82116.1 hypothetical protein BCR32DRAFT_203107 [Anaeromyces robustus]